MGTLVNFPATNDQVLAHHLQHVERRDIPQLELTDADRVAIGKAWIMLIGHPSIPAEITPAINNCFREMLGGGHA